MAQDASIQPKDIALEKSLTELPFRSPPHPPVRAHLIAVCLPLAAPSPHPRITCTPSIPGPSNARRHYSCGPVRGEPMASSRRASHRLDSRSLFSPAINWLSLAARQAPGQRVVTIQIFSSELNLIPLILEFSITDHPIKTSIIMGSELFLECRSHYMRNKEHIAAANYLCQINDSGLPENTLVGN
jgi:hypothetical protein